MKTILILPDGTPVEFPSKYLKYGNSCYFAITPENHLVQVDTTKETMSISLKIFTDIYLDLLKESVPVTGAEFENMIERTFQSLYGSAIQS